MSVSDKLAPVVSVINMKGGVGKTTITANVFREIFRTHNIKTLLVDFDPQFNLSQLLLTKERYEQLRAEGKTLLHVMDPPVPTSVFTIAESDTLDVSDVDIFTHQMRYMKGKAEIDLHLLPGDFEVAMLNLREKQESLQSPRKRFDNFLLKAREKYDLVVLDCNPSSSFLTRCAVENSTHLLIPVRPDKYSLLGVEMIHNYVNKFPSLTRKPKMMIALNDMSDDPDHLEVQSQLRVHSVYGPSTLVNVLPRTKLLASKSSYSGFAVDRKVKNRYKLTGQLTAIGSEIAKRLGVI